MENFNPIKELKPEDPFNAPEGGSSDEIESIRLTLISTRNKTRELVNVIKKKNLDFVKDTTTIKDLDRRLRITIARIPIMRGDASTRSGQDKDPSMIFRAFNRRSRTTKTTKPTTTRVRPTPKIGERIKNAIIDAILLLLPIKIPTKIPGLGKLFKPLLKRLGIGKKALEETLESTASKKSAGFNILNFFRKQFSKKSKPSKLTREQIRLKNIRKTLEEAEEVIPNRKPRVQREDFFNRGKVKNAASDYTGPVDLLATQINRTVKAIKDIVKTKPFKVTRSRRRNRKNLTGQDKVTFSDKVDLTRTKDLFPPKPNEKKILKRLIKNINKAGGIGQGDSVRIKKYNQNRSKKTYQKTKNLKGKDGAFLNGKSMNNDIAMLNRDTSVTRTVVIATGEIA